jgi:hypothetical protein
VSARDLDTAVLGPLARTIAATIQATPVRLGNPEGAADLTGAITLAVAAYMGRELGPDAGVLGEVSAERERQDAKFGEQNHPDGTGGPVMRQRADEARAQCQYLAANGGADWRAILLEEVHEALAESAPARLRAELVQVAAVAVAWVGAIDRREAAVRAGGE